jgi:hypothetical protein
MINLILRRGTETVHFESHVCWKADRTEHGLGEDERRDLHVRETTIGVNDFAIIKASILNGDRGVNKYHGCVDFQCFDHRDNRLVPPRMNSSYT